MGHVAQLQNKAGREVIIGMEHPCEDCKLSGDRLPCPHLPKGKTIDHIVCDSIRTSTPIGAQDRLVAILASVPEVKTTKEVKAMTKATKATNGKIVLMPEAELAKLVKALAQDAKAKGKSEGIWVNVVLSGFNSELRGHGFDPIASVDKAVNSGAILRRPSKVGVSIAVNDGKAILRGRSNENQGVYDSFWGKK